MIVLYKKLKKLKKNDKNVFFLKINYKIKIKPVNKP